MSFKNIKDVLSRDEMKEIMAGSGRGGTGSCGTCSVAPGQPGQGTMFGCFVSFTGCTCSGNHRSCR